MSGIATESGLAGVMGALFRAWSQGRACQAGLMQSACACGAGLMQSSRQVHRLSTDFRAATRIVTERVPTAAELPPGTPPGLASGHVAAGWQP